VQVYVACELHSRVIRRSRACTKAQDIPFSHGLLANSPVELASARRYGKPVMALSRQTLHTGTTLRLHRVSCRPSGIACGPVELVSTDVIVFPLRGLFVKHARRDERIVADGCHALLFSAGEPYRVSHPLEGGDECLVLEPGEALREGIALRARVASLDARSIAARKLLAYRLEQRLASPLEAEERALELLARVAQAPALPPSSSRRSRLRHAEMVEATRIHLARDSARSWTLDELARKVYSSPFHLARTFRRLAGMPLHRYEMRARLAAALDEVLDTRRELTAIALELGFSSHSHFTASFRAAFGLAPSILRKSSKILTARREAGR
jgi:AraC family transcriptional regulator